MTLEDQIAALLAEAEPLRCLPDEEAEAKGLPALVDRINALRVLQGERAAFMASVASLELTEEREQEIAAQVQRTQEAKRRGRPPKAKE